MLNIKGSFSISRTTGGHSDHEVRITVEDEEAGVKFLTQLEQSYEQSKALKETK